MIKPKEKKARHMVKVAVHLFLLRDEVVLLLRRYNTDVEDGNYSVVAGHLDENESIKAATIREAYEEVGIELAWSEVGAVGVMQRKMSGGYIDFFLVARHWKDEPSNREPEKCDNLAWFKLKDLSSGLVPYVRTALSNYRAGKWFDSYE